jgi:hypothetical protein
MNRTIILTTATAALFFSTAACGQGQPQRDTKQLPVSRQRLNPDGMPGEIGYQGDFVEGYRYTDKTGENIVFAAETDVMTQEEDDDGNIITSNKAACAHRYRNTENGWEEVWRVYDMEFDCINEPVAEIVRGALSITDLDSDGTAELWIMYIKSCHGDVSPDSLYLRMYINEEVYTMKGEALLEYYYNNQWYSTGGEYTFGDGFLNRNTPAAYVDYAKRLWEKHKERKF